MERRRQLPAALCVSLVLGVFALVGCAKTADPDATGYGCDGTVLTGSSWVPSVTGVSAANHDGTVTLERATQTITGQPLIGLAQAAPLTKEVTVSIPMTADLGARGSLSLVAEVVNKSAINGGTDYGVYPMLVSLSDGTNEFINLARGAGTCGTSGYYDCTSGCVARSGCTVSWPTAFADRTHWEQHQVPTFGYTSVNTFPTCNWAGGDGTDPTGSLNPQCAFNTNFFSSGKLRSGVTYTAKYVLLAEFQTLPAGYTADLQVTTIKKADATAGGAMDVNVVLVGTKNVAASRTAKGQQNLNALFTEVVSIYGASGLHIGAINAYEWPCESGGDVYANVASGDLGTMFTASKTMFPSATETKALNVFLVSTIPYSSSSGLTILGISGGIGGSMINGTAISGLAFSSFNKLGTYNAGCTGTGTCARAQQEAEFVDMGGTIAHEMGHYLGLNHPSESDGATHDVLRDTPKCTYLGGGTYISISSCRTSTSAQAVYQPSGNKCSTAGVCTGYSPSTGVFCAAAPECQFNHTMWWTSKNFDEASGTGDGNLFSPDSTTLMDYNPYIQ